MSRYPTVMELGVRTDVKIPDSDGAGSEDQCQDT